MRREPPLDTYFRLTRLMFRPTYEVEIYCEIGVAIEGRKFCVRQIDFSTLSLEFLSAGGLGPKLLVSNRFVH